MFGQIAQEGAGLGWPPDRAHTFNDFISYDPDGDPRDISFDLNVDRPDLDTQPGFWDQASGWVGPTILGVGPASLILAMLNASGGGSGPEHFHAELVMFGRDHDNHDLNLLPGWAEMSGASVLLNGVPMSGNVAVEQGAVTIGTLSPEIPGGQLQKRLCLDFLSA